MNPLYESELALIAELPEQPLVIDGGAGHGDWTDAVLQARPQAQVLQFEPHPGHLEILRGKYVGRSEVMTFPFALSNRVGTSLLHIDCHADGRDFGSSLHRRDHHPGQAVMVRTTRLDCLGFEACDLMKLDLEGHELMALSGLGGFRPRVIQFEHGGTWRDASAKLSVAVMLLEGMGYRLEGVPEEFEFANVVARRVEA
jgi:FkbM family methyltransferase